MNYRKLLAITAVAAAAAPLAMAQSAADAFNFSQSDLKGTARFMSMGGAFGALGGDLSTMSQNPAGVGVYRNNDIGFTLNLDCQRATSTSNGFSQSLDQTKFLLNNIGGVFTLRFPSTVMPNLNIGFTYNKGASFNREYQGAIGLRNSLSNYIAGVANAAGVTTADLESTSSFDPYNPTDGGLEAPWLTILGYDGYMITPTGNADNPDWVGQWQNGTSGTGFFRVREKGSMDEYNISLGGNISNVFYWGMNFGIIDFNYTTNTYWGESLADAAVPNEHDQLVSGTAATDLYNYYNANGSGFNYKIGVIIKPVQELRIGLAFHTPTWYSLTENFSGTLGYSINGAAMDYADTNQGYMGSNTMDFRTPCKLIASLAGVIGSNFILSADYEWQPYHAMRFSTPSSWGWDDGWDYDWDWDPWFKPGKQSSMAKAPKADNGPYSSVNHDIKTYYRSQHAFRVGAEYRVTPQFSLRAGYSYVSSPVKDAAKDNQEIIYTSGTMPNYTFNNSTNYITGGFGYRYKRFSIDMAYVYKHISADYHAYTPDPASPQIPSPQAELGLSNHQIVLSAGLRF